MKCEDLCLKLTNREKTYYWVFLGTKYNKSLLIKVNKLKTVETTATTIKLSKYTQTIKRDGALLKIYVVSTKF